MTATITAKTARGAASQIIKVLRRDAVKMLGLTAQEAENCIIISAETEGDENEWYLPGEHRPTKAERTSYEITWEGSSPYEWAITATGGGNIWDWEGFAPGDDVICGAPTLKMPTDAKWVAEPSTSFSISIW
jgi:hypothetical protein